MDDEDENLVDWGYDDDDETKETLSSHDHSASENADGFDALIGEDTISQPSKGPSLLSRISGNIQPVSLANSKKIVQNETHASNSIRDPPDSGRSSAHRPNDTTSESLEKISAIEASPSQSAPSSSRSALSDASLTTGRRSSGGREGLPPKISSNRQPTADSVRLKSSRPADSYIPDDISTQCQPLPPPLPRSQHSAHESTGLGAFRPSLVTEETFSLDGLSAEWEIRTSRTSQGAKYYFNKRTKQSSWERPEGAKGTGSNADLSETGKHGSNTFGLNRLDRVDTELDRRRSGVRDGKIGGSRLTNYASRDEDDRRRNRAEGWDLERDRQAGRECRSDISMNERRDRQTAIETGHQGLPAYSSRSSSNSFQEAHDRSTPSSRNDQPSSNPQHSSPASGAFAPEETSPAGRISLRTGDRSLNSYRDKSRDKPPFPHTTTSDLSPQGEPIPSRGPGFSSEARSQTVVPSGPRNTVPDRSVDGAPYGRRRAPPAVGVNAVSVQGSAMRRWGTSVVGIDERKQTTEAALVSTKEDERKRREEEDEVERQTQKECDKKKREEDGKEGEKNTARLEEKPKEGVPSSSSAYDPTAPFELSEEEKALILAKRQRAAQEEHARVIRERDDRLPDNVPKTGEQATRDAYSRRRQPPDTAAVSSSGREQISTPACPTRATRDGMFKVAGSVVDSTGERTNKESPLDVVGLTSLSSSPAVVAESTVPSKRGYDDSRLQQSSTPSGRRNGDGGVDRVGDNDEDREGQSRSNRPRHQDVRSDDVNGGQPRPVVPGWGPGSRRGGRGGIPERPPSYGPPRGGGRGGFGRGGRGDAWSGARHR